MKRKILISTFLLFGLLSFSQKGDEKVEYLLKGKLINGFDGLTPLCGVLAWATVTEFEIIEFSDKEYVGEKIPIIFTCPNSYHKNLFKVGGIYHMVLTQNEDLKKWTFRNDKADILSKYDIKNEYWFVETKKTAGNNGYNP
ncbi:hypothetical protein [Flagellimonas sp. 2504JD4-2]